MFNSMKTSALSRATFIARRFRGWRASHPGCRPQKIHRKSREAICWK